MRDAIMLALHRTDEIDGETIKRIYRVADQLVLKACTGDVPAIKEVIDRVDGRAHQSVSLDGAVEVNTTTATDRDRAKAVAALVAKARKGVA